MFVSVVMVLSCSSVHCNVLFYGGQMMMFLQRGVMYLPSAAANDLTFVPTGIA